MFWLLIKCACCGCNGVLPAHRQHTNYNNDDLNWVHYLCEPCSEQNDAHWESMWAEYYGSVL